VIQGGLFFFTLNHPTIVNASIKRNIFLYDKGDYESYRNLLSVVDWDGIFRNDDGIKMEIKIN
jgi:ABC-type transport system involved in cytochrome bd biosynthesis fused ATPase/permease subunit